MCPLRRKASLKRHRKFYVLTKPTNPPKRYPDESKNLAECVSYPLLNQPPPRVLANSFTNLELHEGKWLINYLAQAAWNRILAVKVNSENSKYTTNDDYFNLLERFRSGQTKGVVPLNIPGAKVK